MSRKIADALTGAASIAFSKSTRKRAWSRATTRRIRCSRASTVSFSWCPKSFDCFFEITVRRKCFFRWAVFTS